MPYPAQVDLETIVNTAREMIEAVGVEQLSLGRLAAELGIKAPSLYRYVEGKDGLLQAVNTRTVERLFEAMNAALETAPADPVERLLALSQAYRAFAQDNPQTYAQAMTNTVDARRPDETYMVQLVLPLQAMMAEVAGEERSLPALRGLLALVHGFCLLEFAQQLRRGGDLDAAFSDSVRAYIRGWSQPC